MYAKLSLTVFFSLTAFVSGAVSASKPSPPPDDGKGRPSFLEAVAGLNLILLRDSGSTLFPVTYDKKGVVFSGPQRKEARRYYGYLLSAATEEALVQLTAEESAVNEIFWDRHPDLTKAALFALFRLSPEAGVRSARRLIHAPHPETRISMVLPADQVRSADKWQTVPRAAFYLLLKSAASEAKLEVVEETLKSASCPLVVCDAWIYRKATEEEREFFLDNGEWPDPRKDPPDGFLASILRNRKLREKERGPEAASAYRTVTFPDLPVFWTLEAWRGPERKRVLISALKAAGKVELWPNYLSWQEFAYRELVSENRKDTLSRLLRSEDPLCQVLGTAGLVELSHRRGRLDWDLLDRALSHETWVSVVAGCEDERPLVFGAAVLSRVSWGGGSQGLVPSEYVSGFVSLCLKRRRPLGVNLLIARDSLRRFYRASPLSSSTPAGTLLIRALEELSALRESICEGRLVFPSEMLPTPRDVFWLNRVKKNRALLWLLDNLCLVVRDPKRDRPNLIRACRYFGAEELGTLAGKLQLSGGEEKEAFSEAALAARKRVQAHKIFTAAQEGKVSAADALKALIRLRHYAAFPFMWDLLKVKKGGLPVELQRNLRSALKELPAEFPEDMLKAGMLKLLHE